MERETLTLGRRLRARRYELGRTLKEVADDAGVSLPYLSNLERDRGNPTLEVLDALAAALDVSVAELVSGDGGSDVDTLDLLLASAPESLIRYSRSARFSATIGRLAANQGEDEEEMRRRVLTAMASAPRRSKGEPRDEDWRRLLDTFRLILEES